MSDITEIQSIEIKNGLLRWLNSANVTALDVTTTTTLSMLTTTSNSSMDLVVDTMEKVGPYQFLN